MARPEQLVATALHTFTAYSCAPGAMPIHKPSALRPAVMSATWVPWPPQSIGFGSGSSTAEVVGHLSPTKSKPPTTLLVKVGALVLAAVGPQAAALEP